MSDVQSDRCYLYLLAHQELPEFKIGIANDIDKRVKQIGHAIDVAKSLCVPGTRDACYRAEGALHRILGAYRLPARTGQGGTEWFSISCLPIALKWIERLSDEIDLGKPMSYTPRKVVIPPKQVRQDERTWHEKREAGKVKRQAERESFNLLHRADNKAAVDNLKEIVEMTESGNFIGLEEDDQHFHMCFRAGTGMERFFKDNLLSLKIWPCGSHLISSMTSDSAYLTFPLSKPDDSILKSSALDFDTKHDLYLAFDMLSILATERQMDVKSIDRRITSELFAGLNAAYEGDNSSA